MKRVRRVPAPPKRKADSHKGDYGRVLVVAGSYGMAGAAALCARGAYRAGAGLVYVAVPERIYHVVAPLVPEAVLDPYPGKILSKAALPIITARAARCDVLAVGPGLTQEPDADRAFVVLLKVILKELNLPVVLDADGLNLAARHREIVEQYTGAKVLTPHPGEAARLLGRAIEDREQAAVELARRFKCVTVLKGRDTIVTDGSRMYINTTGNPGMASGGTGDVLTGVIAALIGQRMEPFDASVLGVHRHGLAGDIAAKHVGEMSLMATDILEALPAAFQRR